MSTSKKFILSVTFAIMLSFFGSSNALWATILSVPSQYTTIQAAINAAAQFGDVIEITDGIYLETGMVVNKKIVTIKSQNGPEHCIIDCKNNGRGFSFYDVGEYAELDGFTIQNASFGAIYCQTASPTIRNCIFNTNSNSYGGGIACWVSSPTIKNCNFEGNAASSDGGGLYCYDNSSPIVLNCKFTSNSAGKVGGAIYCGSNSDPLIMNCVIKGNLADDGAALCSSTSCYPKIYNSSVILNTAGRGSLVYLQGNDFGNNAYATFKNCIIWDNSNLYSTDYWENKLYISYSNIQTEYEGAGNISQNPKFLSYFDPHLKPDSPCIDAGTPQNLETDLDGNPRVQGRSIDMGAYEFVFENPLGDLNKDKKVDLNDAILIIQFIHGNAPDINVSSADFTNDNAVNIFDAVKLVQYIVKNIDAL
jgi:parallel beta-helix repeat protein